MTYEDIISCASTSVLIKDRSEDDNNQPVKGDLNQVKSTLHMSKLLLLWRARRRKTGHVELVFRP